MAKRSDNICFSCLKEFPDKESYWVNRHDSYRVIYCMDCIMEKAITDYVCLTKPRKPRKKKEDKKIETNVS
jgi:hypothetical protein